MEKNKKQKDKKIKVYFCPKCKSYKVKFIFGVGNIFGIIPKQKCFDCGFEMQNFPILVTTKTRLEEDFVKRKKLNKYNKSKKRRKKK